MQPIKSGESNKGKAQNLKKGNTMKQPNRKPKFLFSCFYPYAHIWCVYECECVFIFIASILLFLLLLPSLHCNFQFDGNLSVSHLLFSVWPVVSFVSLRIFDSYCYAFAWRLHKYITVVVDPHKASISSSFFNRFLCICGFVSFFV